VSINTCILCDGKSVAFGYLFLFDFQLWIHELLFSFDIAL
jgi:hypothetical protein